MHTWFHVEFKSVDSQFPFRPRAIFKDLRDAVRWIDQELLDDQQRVEEHNKEHWAEGKLSFPLYEYKVTMPVITEPVEYEYNPKSSNSMHRAPTEPDMREWLAKQGHVFYTVHPLTVE